VVRAKVLARKQWAYGLWAIETGGGGLWLAWHEVRLNARPWDQKLLLGASSDVYVFTAKRAEIQKVLNYVRGRNVPEHVRRHMEQQGVAFILPDGVERIVIRRCHLPAPAAPTAP
jgi:hypothetical protein